MHWKSIWAVPLIMITEGHMSGSVDTLSLPEVVRRSEAIFLVEKADPHVVQRKERIGKKKGQEFAYTYYRYKVLKVIHTNADKAPKSGILEVQDAADEGNARETRNHFQGKPTKVLIYKVYEPKAAEVDSLQEFLVFTTYLDARKRFAFVAQNAMESGDQTPEVLGILESRGKVPKH